MDGMKTNKYTLFFRQGLIATLVFGILSLSLAPFYTNRALAATQAPSGFVFVYEPSKTEPIRQEINGLSNNAQLNLSSTKIYAGGSAFNSGAKKTVLDFHSFQKSTGGGTVVYKKTLSCTIRGKSVRTYLTVNLPLDNNFDKKTSYFGTESVKSYEITDYNGDGSYERMEEGDFGKVHSSSCFMKSMASDALKSVTIKNYQKLSRADKNSWNGLSTASDDRGDLSEPSPEEAKEQPDCDASLNSPLSWVLCPVIDLGAALTDFIFQTFVRGLLEEVPISAETDDGGYLAWQQFRMLANIMLVGTLLAIVYGQVKGDR